MTQDEIIEMAKQSGAFEYYEINLWADGDENPLIFFAKLIDAKSTAKEREACARLVEIEDGLTRDGVASKIRSRNTK